MSCFGISLSEALEFVEEFDESQDFEFDDLDEIDDEFLLSFEDM